MSKKGSSEATAIMDDQVVFNLINRVNIFGITNKTAKDQEIIKGERK